MRLQCSECLAAPFFPRRCPGTGPALSRTRIQESSTIDSRTTTPQAAQASTLAGPAADRPESPPGTLPRKSRARSQARIELILAAARVLLASEGVNVSIYAVAERAQIPPSSVYHFFPSVPALLQALTADIHASFRACLQAPIDAQTLHTWRDLSRILEQRMLAIYSQDPAARQLILAQHGLSEVTQADRLHDLELGALVQQVFDRYFQLPSLPEEVDVFALAMELGDRVYARSVQLHGTITPRMAEEGMRVFDAYMGLYLPPYLARRG